MKINFFVFLLFLLGVANTQIGPPSFYAFTSSSHLSMGGAGFLNPSPIALKVNPSNYIQGRQFATSLIRYPADITSQSVGFSSSLEDGFYSLSIKSISYGTFKGYNDEAQLTEPYSSSVSKLTGVFSKNIKNFPASVGSSISFSSTTLYLHNYYTIESSIGGKMYFKKTASELGISVHGLGNEISSNRLIKFYPETVISFSKKLTYLPVKVFGDFLLFNSYKNKEFFLGGILKINNDFHISVGSSTRKIDQNIQQDMIKSILGATGFGFAYDVGMILVTYGIYYYGTGSHAQGLEIGISI